MYDNNYQRVKNITFAPQVLALAKQFLDADGILTVDSAASDASTASDASGCYCIEYVAVVITVAMLVLSARETRLCSSASSKSCASSMSSSIFLSSS